MTDKDEEIVYGSLGLKRGTKRKIKHASIEEDRPFRDIVDEALVEWWDKWNKGKGKQESAKDGE